MKLKKTSDTRCGVFAHHSSRWLYVLHCVSTQRSQDFVLVHEHVVILRRLPDVLFSVPHEHHLLSVEQEQERLKRAMVVVKSDIKSTVLK